jgi:alanyl-tRNA synthetase
MHTTSHDIRRRFLDYFKKQGHREIASSPVIPHDDPTLLFTNAGMNQFKDVFLGKSKREYTRATTSQKCIRAGGKHNDLENVGHTRRHLTFFEMLGNFSFGDYFKKEAIQFAWEVSTQIFCLPEEKIWPTVFRDDDEAAELWTKYVPSSRIIRLGEKDNFWAMGDTGPCGPCSELLFDRGAKYGDATSPLNDASGERFLEFWNLVFMQYNRLQDGTKELLPRPSIDTGAGLERVMSLLLDTETVYETDVLRSLIGSVEEQTGRVYDPHSKEAPAFRVIADHMRSLSFAIADGAQPSNTDRGYVLRKILRRAVRYARQLGIQKPFLGTLLPSLCETMGESYPELITSKDRIVEILTIEEESFIRTLKRGGAILNGIISRSEKIGSISGDDAFLLKDTYGLPFDEIVLFAKDYGCTVEQARFLDLEEEAKKRSQAARKQAMQMAEKSIYEELVARFGEMNFEREANSLQAEVLACIRDGEPVSSLLEGEEGEILLSRTPFYPEMGGQIGDSGSLISQMGLFQVKDTKSPYNGLITHQGKLEQGTLSVGDSVIASIDIERRKKIEANHTATHLLHWALGVVLGGHIRQRGSYVDDQHLRFDFSHHKQMSDDEISQVEKLVNQAIQSNIFVKTYALTYEEAQKRPDIRQYFGEKYGNEVRVVEAGHSQELCGGTHTLTTGQVGFFRISKEASIAAGMRRIEAVTQEEAYLFSKKAEERIQKLAVQLKVPEAKLEEKIDKLLLEVDRLEANIVELKRKSLGRLIEHMEETKTPFGSIYTAILESDASDIKLIMEEIAKKAKDYMALVVGFKAQGKAHLAVRISDSKVSEICSAKKLLAKGLHELSGKGGGNELYAQGASDAIEKLPQAIASILSSF